MWSWVKDRSLRMQDFQNQNSFHGFTHVHDTSFSLRLWFSFNPLSLTMLCLCLLLKALEINLPHMIEKKWSPKPFIYIWELISDSSHHLFRELEKQNGNSSIPLLNRLDFCFLKVVYNKYNSVFYCREHFYFVWICLCVLCLLLYTQQFKQNYEIKLKYRQNIVHIFG